MDEKSRFLLKDLLDGAAENVFRTVSEGLDVISLGELLPCDMERAKVKTSYSSKPKVLQVLYKFVIFLYQVKGDTPESLKRKYLLVIVGFLITCLICSTGHRIYLRSIVFE